MPPRPSGSRSPNPSCSGPTSSSNEPLIPTFPPGGRRCHYAAADRHHGARLHARPRGALLHAAPGRSGGTSDQGGGDEETRMRETTAGIIAALFLSILLTPLSADAQQSGRVYRIGVLQIEARERVAYLLKAFEEGLRKLGYVEGRDFVSEYRFADRQRERLPHLAAELVRLKVDVIVTGTDPGTIAAKQATTTIPIVMAVGGRSYWDRAHRQREAAGGRRDRLGRRWCPRAHRQAPPALEGGRSQSLARGSLLESRPPAKRAVLKADPGGCPEAGRDAPVRGGPGAWGDRKRVHQNQAGARPGAHCDPRRLGALSSSS